MARGRIYNNFYTPELWEQVNKENKRILEDFYSLNINSVRNPKIRFRPIFKIYA